MDVNETKHTTRVQFLRDCFSYAFGKASSQFGAIGKLIRVVSVLFFVVGPASSLIGRFSLTPNDAVNKWLQPAGLAFCIIVFIASLLIGAYRLYVQLEQTSQKVLVETKRIAEADKAALQTQIANLERLTSQASKTDSFRRHLNELIQAHDYRVAQFRREAREGGGRLGSNLPLLTGKNCFEAYYDLLRTNFHNGMARWYQSLNIPDELLPPEAPRTKKDIAKAAYIEMLKSHDSPLSSYFSSLYRIITEIAESDIEDKTPLINTAIASLSNHELALIFYDGLCRDNAKPLIEKYGLLRGFNRDFLFEREAHEPFYATEAYV